MRVIVFQAPKLTYVQAIELLLRETKELIVDIAVLPENAVEHPPQVTDQGELNKDNVAIMLISRFARQKRMYIVLGSLEEKGQDGRIYDTCVVFDRSGEIIMRYRKQTPDLGKAAGTVPGLFSTELGPVGVLLGIEAEEEIRWAPIIAASPWLVLNPVNAPLRMDSALAKAHPELQVSAWHQGFQRMQSIVESKTRAHPCCFLRADAPLRMGGAGTSMLVEPHRSVLAPGWGPAAIVAEPTPSAELTIRRPPGWRELDVDEIIKAANHDRDLLKYEEVEMGPRYLVWTMQTPSSSHEILTKKVDWSDVREQPTLAEEPKDSGKDHEQQEASNSGRQLVGTDVVKEPIPESVMGREASCYLLPITTRDGRNLYVATERSAAMTFWDVRQKREWRSYSLINSVGGKSGGTKDSDPLARDPGGGLGLDNLWRLLTVTATGLGPLPFQFIVAASTPLGIILRIFDEATVLQGISLPFESLPWDRWEKFPEPEGSLDSSDDELEDGQPAKLSAHIRAIFLVDSTTALAVAEPSGDRPEAALLLNLETGTSEFMDIYAEGPPPPSAWNPEPDESLEFASATLTGTLTSSISMSLDQEASQLSENADSEEPVRDKLATAMLVSKQVFQEEPGQQQMALVCLWQSNRVCILTFNTWELHEQMLLDENATLKNRLDVPLCSAVLNNPQAGTFNFVVSYTSSIIRWWQVSLSGAHQQACLVTPSPVTKLSLLRWPTQGNGEMYDVSGQVKGASGRSPRSRGAARAKVSAASHRRGSGSELAQVEERRSSFKRDSTLRRGSNQQEASDRRASLESTSPRRDSAMSQRRGSAVSIQGQASFSSGRDSWLQNPGARRDSVSSQRRDSWMSAVSPKRESAIMATIRRESGMSIFDAATPRRGSQGSFQRQSSYGAKSGSPVHESPEGLVGSVLIAGTDLTGAMSLYLGQVQDIKKVYSCMDQSFSPRTIVDQVWCLDQAIVMQLRSGDVRHIEFLLEEELMRLIDLQLA